MKFIDIYRYYFEKRNYTNRLKIINYFIQTSFKPVWILIKYLPILPPNLRPVVELENNTVIVTDLNFLYLNILRINKLITVLKIAILMEELIVDEKLSLQYNVDKLINNEKSKPSKSILGSKNLRKFFYFLVTSLFYYIYNKNFVYSKKKLLSNKKVKIFNRRY